MFNIIVFIDNKTTDILKGDFKMRFMDPIPLKINIRE